MIQANYSNSSLKKHKVIVLLIDDQETSAEPVRQALSSEEDIELQSCQDSSKAIKLASKINATVILLDPIMDDREGLKIVHDFRTNKFTAQIPIIVMSTKEEATIKSEAFRLGANDYIVKFPDKIELIARIRYHSQAYIYQLERDEAFRALEKNRAELAEVNRTLRKLSSIDVLTGIANRRSFDETLRKEWYRTMRGSKSISLIMIDIDFFKRYNDHYGHQGGDDCLRKVVKALQAKLHRETDFLARYGGEEFSAILPDTDLSGALKVAEEMREAIKAQRIDHAKSTISKFVSISIGVSSVTPQQGTQPEDLITAADQALYRAKEEGRDRIKSGKVKSEST